MPENGGPGFEMPLIERVFEKLMRWHDPAADRLRDLRYQALHRRARAVRRRADTIIAYRIEEDLIAKRRTPR